MAETYWPPVSDIVTDLRRALASDVKCNVYCTPPESQGFDTHVDGHDVLVLQTSGSKTWRIHDVQTELPVESSPLMNEMFPRLAGSMPDYGEPTREVVLRPGDLLYLPRGVPHSAASNIGDAPRVAQCLHAAAVILDGLKVHTPTLPQDLLRTQQAAHERSRELAQQLRTQLRSAPCIPLDFEPLDPVLLGAPARTMANCNLRRGSCERGRVAPRAVHHRHAHRPVIRAPSAGCAGRPGVQSPWRTAAPLPEPRRPAAKGGRRARPGGGGAWGQADP